MRRMSVRIAVLVACALGAGAALAPAAGAAPQARWTFAISMCSDNDPDLRGS